MQDKTINDFQFRDYIIYIVDSCINIQILYTKY